MANARFPPARAVASIPRGRAENMSQNGAANVYKGLWINWSRGTILGSTLTLSDRDGALLIAFLAIFVSAAGGALWRIISYIIHQSRAKLAFQDGLHHQQQVVFRNASTPGSASWQLLQLLYYWWNYAKNPVLRVVPLATLAFVNLVLFALAGVFSAEVIKAAGNEVLVRSPKCGTWGISFNATPGQQAAFRSKTLLDTTSASTYARSCYGQTQDPLACAQYTRPNIPWAVSKNVTCPFRGDMCKLGGTSAYQMDTGHIDSHQVLGVNAPPTDRITYRKVTTCSPITTKGYASEWNNTDPSALTFGDTYDQIYFGVFPGITNWTYEYNEHTLLERTGYQLSSVYASPGPAGNAWIPIAELNRTDADVSIFFLAQNAITYDTPVSDPFFGANIEESIPAVGTGPNTTAYTTDKYVTALGCVDQHQFCNPSTDQCTPLAGSNLVNQSFNSLNFNSKQLATAWRLVPQLIFINMHGSVSGRGSNALRASETLSDLEQVGLPNNQWQIEVDSWMAVGMAKLQQLIVQYATGPPSVVGDSFTLKPTSGDWQAMCDAQKIRSSNGTTSFSILGVSIILVLGTFLVVLNLILDTVVGLIQRKLDWGDHKRLQWVIDEKLQLQRLAYEAAGQGTWTGGANTVPVMTREDRIGIPRNADKTHPKLHVSGHGRPESLISSPSQLQGDMSLRQSRIPEAENLMGLKGAWYDVQSVEPAVGYHGYQH